MYGTREMTDSRTRGRGRDHGPGWWEAGGGNDAGTHTCTCECNRTRAHACAYTCAHVLTHARPCGSGDTQHGPGSRRCPRPGCDAVRQSRVAPVGRPGEGRVGPPCPFCIFPPIFNYRRERQKRPSRGTAGRTPPAQGAAASWARARRSGCGGRGSSRRPHRPHRRIRGPSGCAPHPHPAPGGGGQGPRAQVKVRRPPAYVRGGSMNSWMVNCDAG